MRTNNHNTGAGRRCLRRERGFTLVELMITVAIALFLIGGLLTVLQNVRGSYNNQQLLSQLQDQQRFALTVLTDVIQAGGYFPDPKAYDPTNALPASAPYAMGQAFYGTHPAANGPDTIGVRYRTNQGEQVIFCDGTINTTQAPDGLFVNQLTVVPPTGGNPWQLQCQVTNAATGAVNTVSIVNGVQNLIVYYGVKRNPVPADYNVDTYLTADQMAAADWNNVSSVRVLLTFTNPLCTPTVCQPGQQPTIQFERVIEVMSRAGVHT